jgi:hypothetical protein
MKLASYLLDGRPSYGAVEGNGVVDLAAGSAPSIPICAPSSRRTRWTRRSGAAGAKADASFDSHAPPGDS